MGNLNTCYTESNYFPNRYTHKLIINSWSPQRKIRNLKSYQPYLLKIKVWAYARIGWLPDGRSYFFHPKRCTATRSILYDDTIQITTWTRVFDCIRNNLSSLIQRLDPRRSRQCKCRMEVCSTILVGRVSLIFLTWHPAANTHTRPVVPRRWQDTRHCQHFQNWLQHGRDWTPDWIPGTLVWPEDDGRHGTVYSLLRAIECVGLILTLFVVAKWIWWQESWKLHINIWLTCDGNTDASWSRISDGRGIIDLVCYKSGNGWNHDTRQT